MTITLTPLPPREAVAYFRSKGYAPALRRFDWRDIWKEEHARSFTVAKAMQDDVLQMIREELDKALAEGLTLEQFRASLKPKLVSAGWWGKQIERDPATGELREVQLGSNHRLRTIFDTNMRTSYAAGRWARIQRTKGAFPFLAYRQIQRPSKRDTHEPYHLIILPVDHPVWEIIYPPNGFFCGCSVRQMNQRMLDREGLKVTEDFELEHVTWFNERTGKNEQLPIGISPGFDSNPGHAWLDIEDRHRATQLDLPAAHRATDLAWTREIRARSLRDNDESLIVYDLNDDPGVAVGLSRSVVGRPSEVKPTRAILDRFANPDAKTVAIHSHPSSGSFSSADLNMVLNKPGLHQLVAVGQNGSVFRMSQASASISSGEVNAIGERTLFALRLLMQEGQISRLEAEQVYAHIHMMMLREAGVIDYSASPHGSLADAIRRLEPFVDLIHDVVLGGGL